MRRCITASPLDPTVGYTPGKDFSADFLADYAEWDDIDVQVKFGGRYTLKSTGYYVANRQSDGCPNGFGQEDTIRQIFLGKNAAEDPALTRVVLPKAYRSSSSGTTRTANRQESTASRPVQTTAGASGTKADESRVTQAAGTPGETTGEQPADPTSGSTEESSRVQPEPARKTSLAAVLLPIAGVLLAAAGGAAVWRYKRKKNQNKGEPNP